ncbi:hypothetical protein BVY03_05945 [bacterium K02(2017)]|nr:hypothetical protein BVY03_05945 [bacterium K02(2017)]
MRLTKFSAYLISSIFILHLLTWVLLTRPSLPNFTQIEYNLGNMPKNLELHVRRLSETYSPRDYTNVKNLNLCADYIKNQFEQFGQSKISEQAYQVNNETYKNIIAQYGPTTGDPIVIGTHYDAYDKLPGADDNASGVAGLIEMARLLSKTTLTQPIILVAYSLEEPPFFRTENMGSFKHAKSLSDQNKNIKLMISLEMIGYFTDKKDTQSFLFYPLPLFYPNAGNFIGIVDEFYSNHAHKLKINLKPYLDFPVYTINAPSFIESADFSDHLNYWHFGYPAVMVTDTAFLRNRAYHTKNDTYDRLNYNKMAQIVYGIYRSILIEDYLP